MKTMDIEFGALLLTEAMGVHVRLGALVVSFGVLRELRKPAGITNASSRSL
jgi:hypothetical protein